MRRSIVMLLGSGLLVVVGYIVGIHRTSVVQAHGAEPGIVPKSYGKLITAIPDSIGTGLIFEDTDGTIRFVSVTGMKEGELARYDIKPTRGGIPRAYGHLVAAVVNHGATALVFEDAKGTIRFVTMAGVTEKELARE